MLFLGIDWGERHHDLCQLDQDGMVLEARRIADGLGLVGCVGQAAANGGTTQPARSAACLDRA
jgi:hypothetical protein